MIKLKLSVSGFCQTNDSSNFLNSKWLDNMKSIKSDYYLIRLATDKCLVRCFISIVYHFKMLCLNKCLKPSFVTIL